jgi:hypothetical protein
VGGPPSENWLRRQLLRDQAVLLPLSLAVLLALLFACLRNLTWAVFPVLNAVIAVCWTGGAMAWLGLPVTPLNYMLPALVLVIGATYDVHVIHEFRNRRSDGATPRQAVEQTARQLSLTLLLTSGTTILGFASTAISPVPVLRDFGAVAMIALSARLVVSLLFLPVCFRYAGSLLRSGEDQAMGRWSDRLINLLDRTLYRRTGLVLASIVVLCLVAVLCATRIVVNNSFRAFFRKDSPVSSQHDRLTARLPGLQILNLTLHAAPGTFAEPRALGEVDRIARFLRQQPGVDSVLSIADIVMHINSQVQGDVPGQPSLPASATAVRQLLFFSHPAEYNRLLTPDHASVNLVIRCHLDHSRDLVALADGIRAAMDAHQFGPQVYNLTGRSLLFAMGADAISWAQISSLGGMLASLFVIVWILFLSWRCGVLVVIANMVPVLAVFGVMGLAGIALNVGTCMVAAITLGIAVDDTLHLLVRFNREARRLKDERQGMRSAMRQELFPIMAISIALGAGFAVLGFSSFQPVREFGLLSAAVMLVALVTELVITPVLFSRTRVVTLWDIIGLDLRSALLSRSPFFDGLTSWQARKVILISDIEVHHPGSFVVREGDVGARMYVVLDGNLDVEVGNGEHRKVIASFGMGDVFGEMAFVSHQPRTANVVARTEARLMGLDYRSVQTLRRFSPYLVSQVLLNISRIIAGRLPKPSASSP